MGDLVRLVGAGDERELDAVALHPEKRAEQFVSGFQPRGGLWLASRQPLRGMAPLLAQQRDASVAADAGELLGLGEEVETVFQRRGGELRFASLRDRQGEVDEVVRLRTLLHSMNCNVRKMGE